MPRTTRASLAAAFAASFAPSASSATCVSPTPGDRKATAMFRKRQRDWRMDDDASEPASSTSMDGQVSTSHYTAHSVHHARHETTTHGYHHPPPSASSSSSSTRQRRRLSDDDRSSWKRADHDHDHDHLMVDGNDTMDTNTHDPQHYGDDDDADAADDGSPFKEIQSRVEQVGQQVAQAQRNVAELRALLLKAITSQRKALASRPPTSTTTVSTTTRKARVRIDMLCS